MLPKRSSKNSFKDLKSGTFRNTDSGEKDRHKKSLVTKEEGVIVINATEAIGEFLYECAFALSLTHCA